LNRQASVLTVHVSMATNVHRGVKSTAAPQQLLLCSSRFGPWEAMQGAI